MRRKPKRNVELTHEVYRQKAQDDFHQEEKRGIPVTFQAPTEKKQEKGLPQRSALPYRREALGIVDVYQVETNNEDEGKNILRIELSNGTVRDFVVKNGSKGEMGFTGLGGMRGPRGATGERGPKGEKGAKGAAGEKGEKGDPPSVGFRYEEETGNVYYRVSDAEVLDEEAF